MSLCIWTDSKTRHERIEAGDDLDAILKSLGTSQEALDGQKAHRGHDYPEKTREEMQIACSRFGCVRMSRNTIRTWCNAITATVA
jgi:hypothetical protein